jgi:hypothetical protein
MGGRGGGSPRGASVSNAGVPGPAVSREAQAESAIRSYVLQHQADRSWVTMADIREFALSGFSREEQDAALKNMDNDPNVRIMHWDNRKSLTPRDHAAALPLAGTTMDVVRIL